MRFFTMLNEVAPSTNSSTNSTIAKTNATVTLSCIGPPAAMRGRYDTRYTAICPSDRIHAMMESSARIGRSHLFTLESRANTPMYMTTTNSANDSVHF